MPQLTIGTLRDHPHHLNTLAEWHHAEWASLNPGRSLQQRVADMQAYLSDAAVPSTWIALLDGQLAGSAALVECDMDTHADWSPWLASVFVAPCFRQQGIGSSLVQQVMRAAEQDGLSTLYLFTPDQTAFYRRLGWQDLSQEPYRGHTVQVMWCSLRPDI